MTGTFNQALQNALRRKLTKSADEFVLLRKANEIEKSRASDPKSRFRTLPEITPKFDLRMVERES